MEISIPHLAGEPSRRRKAHPPRPTWARPARARPALPRCPPRSCPQSPGVRARAAGGGRDGPIRTSLALCRLRPLTRRRCGGRGPAAPGLSRAVGLLGLAAAAAAARGHGVGFGVGDREAAPHRRRAPGRPGRRAAAAGAGGPGAGEPGGRARRRREDAEAQRGGRRRRRERGCAERAVRGARRAGAGALPARAADARAAVAAAARAARGPGPPAGVRRAPSQVRAAVPPARPPARPLTWRPHLGTRPAGPPGLAGAPASACGAVRWGGVGWVPWRVPAWRPDVQGAGLAGWHCPAAELVVQVRAAQGSAPALRSLAAPTCRRFAPLPSLIFWSSFLTNPSAFQMKCRSVTFMSLAGFVNSVPGEGWEGDHAVRGPILFEGHSPDVCTLWRLSLEEDLHFKHFTISESLRFLVVILGSLVCKV